MESSYNTINNLSTKTFRGGNENNPTQIVGTIKDLAKNKLGKLTLSLNGSQNQITWRLEGTTGIKYGRPNDPTYIYGFTLSENIVLTKL